MGVVSSWLGFSRMDSCLLPWAVGTRLWVAGLLEGIAVVVAVVGREGSMSVVPSVGILIWRRGWCFAVVSMWRLGERD